MLYRFINPPPAPLTLPVMFALRDDEELQVNGQNRNIRGDMSLNIRDVGHD
jgi:hypothetical protein